LYKRQVLVRSQVPCVMQSAHHPVSIATRLPSLNTARGEQVPKIVMRNAVCACFFARSIKRLLALPNAEHFGGF
jgi:hypothetical protein